MAAEQGSIIWVSFDPSVGHEPSKRRPALVVSSDYFNYRCSLTVVVSTTRLFSCASKCSSLAACLSFPEQAANMTAVAANNNIFVVIIL